MKFKGGGPGLGLTIAQGIAKLHDGKIWVESTGCDEQSCPGSVFYVRLPVERPVSLVAEPGLDGGSAIQKTPVFSK